jgi:hypothetical protein
LKQIKWFALNVFEIELIRNISEMLSDFSYFDSQKMF